jgi:hypothetical protein
MAGTARSSIASTFKQIRAGRRDFYPLRAIVLDLRARGKKLRKLMVGSLRGKEGAQKRVGQASQGRPPS